MGLRDGSLRFVLRADRSKLACPAGSGHVSVVALSTYRNIPRPCASHVHEFRRLINARIIGSPPTHSVRSRLFIRRIAVLDP